MELGTDKLIIPLIFEKQSIIIFNTTNTINTPKTNLLFFDLTSFNLSEQDITILS